MEEIFVVGAGTMGRGIAHVAALTGHRARLFDQDPAQVERAVAAMDAIMAGQVERGKIGEAQRQAALNLVTPVSTMAEGAKGATFAVEAVIEKEGPKKEVLAELDGLLEADAVIATNTSSISITELAHATKRRDKVVGMHFFNPAQVMKLVEVVRGVETSDGTVARGRALADALGKTPIEVRIDSPGFVVNRILMPFLAEAVRVLEEGVASRDDIDTAVKLGLNHPMGPLTLLDFTGVDVCTYVMDYFHQEFGDAKYAPPQTLRRLTRAGHHGRKSGRGFYDYGA